MREDTLSRLSCPYCGGALLPSVRSPHTGSEINSAVLRCDCGEFPLLGGIPIFLREGRVDVFRQSRDTPLATGPEVSRLIELIRDGRPDEALMRLLVWPDRRTRRVLAATELLSPRRRDRFRRRIEEYAARNSARERRVFDVNQPSSARSAMESYARQTGKREHYVHFYHRFGQPRQLSILGVVWALPNGAGPVLDLACGFGHVLHAWTEHQPARSFIGLDRNFIELYVAKRWVAPRAEYVCAWADDRLPFADGAFGTILCSDAFHCFLRKKECAEELTRLLAPDGVLALLRFGNARVEPREGYELDPETYARLFPGLELRFLRDPDALSRYVSGRLADLSGSSDPGTVSTLKWISILASPTRTPFRDSGPMEEWPHGLGRLRLNPLYDVARRPDGASLKLVFPSEWFEFENKECLAYMPERIDVERRVLDDVEAQRRSPEVRDLIRRCVVLGLPEGYG